MLYQLSYRLSTSSKVAQPQPQNPPASTPSNCVLSTVKISSAGYDRYRTRSLIASRQLCHFGPLNSLLSPSICTIQGASVHLGWLGNSCRYDT